jgi:hypothetical protein
MGGVGDGLQPVTQHRSALGQPVPHDLAGRVAVSYRAIACALALEDVSIGERLVAFSLASYANRAHLAWPASRTAAARAGLSRRQYLAARDRLAARRLVALGHETDGVVVMRLKFAEDGPSVEREVNPELFEAVLAGSRSRGGARALLAALAAVAADVRIVEGLTTEEVCAASGLSDRTYRRARSELLAAGEVVLERAGGGRGCQNVWRISDPRPATSGAARLPAVRQAPPSRQMPLVAVVRNELAGAGARDSAERAPGGRPALGKLGVNPGQNRTPQAPETPAETPAPYVRAGRESLNQGTAPPDPPEGGQPAPVEIPETFTSSRGRHRTRVVQADPRELLPIADTDRRTWMTMREQLRETVGASMFEIWLALVEPIAVSRIDQGLLLAAPAESHRWVASRYRRILDALSLDCHRAVRMASDHELALHGALQATPVVVPVGPTFIDDNHQREAM